MAVAGGGAFTAIATGAFDGPAPDRFANMPRSLALSLPKTAGSTGLPVPPLTDPLAEGHVTAPSASARIPYARNAPDPRLVEKDIPTTLPFAFNKTGYQMLPDLPEHLRPWRDRPTSWANTSLKSGPYHLNSQGVYLYYPNGGSVGYDHPVGQIQFGLGCITSYRIEKDPARRAVFLKRAKQQADRLIEKRVETRGAWYFPYPFNYGNPAHGTNYKAPWYSGMSQGEAISLFAQLAQLEGVGEADRVRYKAAADGAFSSLLRAENAFPWVVNKDRAGYLWIQEYPYSTPGKGDYTYNGMIFAVFGVWDYYQLTGNELAAELYDGVLTTVARYFPLLRNPRRFSYYCQNHRLGSDSYHPHHIHLWQQLHWQTNSAVFANQLDQLMDDVPPSGVKPGSVIAIAKGSHTLYKVASTPSGDYDRAGDDKILGTKKVTFARPTQAPADKRRRIQGAGIWYRISAGAYKGWWIGEAWPNVFLRGEHMPVTYRTQRTLTVPANTPVEAYAFGTEGVAGTVKTLKYSEPFTAQFDRRSIINGRAMCHISSGEFADHWVPANQVITDGR
ncbi:D-glucuronyl C5-epimerase family protein [Streptomyces sp. NPDC059176]|uniref:D-glucuronyl C5-epimerase family protein n=1 Tax=unclassified Streptomyces TaxID=2593676 RepID=UPI003673CFB6